MKYTMDFKILIQSNFKNLIMFVVPQKYCYIHEYQLISFTNSYKILGKRNCQK